MNECSETSRQQMDWFTDLLGYACLPTASGHSVDTVPYNNVRHEIQQYYSRLTNILAQIANRVKLLRDSVFIHISRNVYTDTTEYIDKQKWLMSMYNDVTGYLTAIVTTSGLVQKRSCLVEQQWEELKTKIDRLLPTWTGPYTPTTRAMVLTSVISVPNTGFRELDAETDLE